jgi:hypothetical protein
MAGAENDDRREPMRQGQQNRRGRGRSNNSNTNTHTHTHSHNNGRKPQNPLSRNYESSGPDVKIRGTAAQVAEKYLTLARDAASSGDPVLAENYLQHAEHYNRIIMAAQAQAVPHQHHVGEHGPNMNGQQLRPQQNDQFSMREQPQPAVEQSSMLPPGMEPQPEISEPAIAAESADGAENADPGAGEQPAAARETDGRRRRRRYPAGGAPRGNGGTEPGGGHSNGSGNGLDAATENRPPDEVLAS